MRDATLGRLTPMARMPSTSVARNPFLLVVLRRAGGTGKGGQEGGGGGEARSSKK